MSDDDEDNLQIWKQLFGARIFSQDFCECAIWTL